MIRYGQFCPVAKTAEIFGDRWSPLIIRELCYGPRSFGDFLAALPLISRTMLSQRLKELAAADIVHADAKEKGRGYSYTLTAAGEAFRPMINMMAEWGLKWGQGRIGPDDLDSQLLIWGIRQHIDREDITAQEFVLRFDFRGIPKGSRTPRHWWMLIRRDEIEVCLKDPGQNLDVMIEADHEAEYTGGLVHWDCHFGSRKVLTARGEWQTPVLFGVLSFPARLPPAMVPVGERREHRPRFVSGLSKARFAAFRHERQRHRHDGGRDHRRLGPARHPA
jgi:DNA-binding HxlR family transcriptional regulator